jgi:hypothetical protein
MVCLTFDDGLPCHYKTVIPELNPARDGKIGTKKVPLQGDRLAASTGSSSLRSSFATT